MDLPYHAHTAAYIIYSEIYREITKSQVEGKPLVRTSKAECKIGWFNVFCPRDRSDTKGTKQRGWQSRKRRVRLVWMNEWINEWIKMYIWRIKTSTWNLACLPHQIHTAHHTHRYVSSQKLELPKTFIPIKYKRPLPARSLPKVKLYIAQQKYIQS